MKENGIDGLPVTFLDGEIVITGKYPSNDEFVQLLNVPTSYIGETPSTVKDTNKKTKSYKRLNYFVGIKPS